MRILVTGHEGYIGCRLVPLFLEAGHDVVGLDSGLFRDCTFGPPSLSVPEIDGDVRDTTPDDLAGFDAVVHLAGISNDPLGDLDPECTYDINHRATVHLAEVAKEAGVGRFLFSSSCSLYGAAGDDMLDESVDFNPVTPYGWSKVYSERDLLALADDSFSPTFLRNATAYGASYRLRGDLVVNNLTAYAFSTGEVFMKSDGTPWRPLVHIEDISRAFLAIAEAPRELSHCEAFNVGATEENYKIREVGALVESVVEGSQVVFAENAGPDARNYRVNCDKLARTFPAFTARWTVGAGIRELVAAYEAAGLTVEQLTSAQLQRIKTVQAHRDAGRLDSNLRWQGAEAVGAGA